jgi:hypothetical protein
MEAVGSSETLVFSRNNSWRSNMNDRNLYLYRLENLKRKGYCLVLMEVVAGEVGLFVEKQIFVRDFFH